MKRKSVPRNGVKRPASLPDDVRGDAVVDELVGHLDDVLHARRHQLHLPAAADEDQHEDQQSTRCMTSSAVLLIAKGVPSNQMSFHRKSSSIGGNVKAPSTARTAPPSYWSRARLQAGAANVRLT